MPKSKPESNRTFWIISAVLHLAIFVLIFLTPAGQTIFTRKERPLKPEIIRQDEELAKVIDDVRDLAAQRLKSQVELLEAGQQRMASNFETMNKHYQPFVSDQISTARERLGQEGTLTVSLQKELLTAIKNAVEKKEHGSDPMWRAYDSRRGRIVAGQEEIRRALMLTSSQDTELVALQTRTEDNQMKVFTLISDSVSAQNGLWSTPKERERLEGRLAAAEKNIELYSGRLKAAPENRKEQEVTLEARKKQLEATTKEIADLKKEINSTPAEQVKELEALRKKLAGLEKQAEKEKSGIARIEKAIAKIETDAETWKTRLASAEESIAGYRQDLEQLSQNIPQKTQARDEFASQAAALQETVINDQQSVYDTLLKRLSEAEKEAEMLEAAGASTNATEVAP